MKKKSKGPAKASKSLKEVEEEEAGHDEGDAADDLGDLLGDGPEEEFKVDQKFAKKFNEKKDKMEAARAAKVLADEDIGSDSSEESTEDEQAELLTGHVENKIFDTLQKIKAKDPSIYNSKGNFFTDEDFKEENTAKAEKGGSSDKKMTYNKFLRDTLMKEGADAISREEEELEKKKSRKVLKTPAEEQRELREEIVAAAKGFDAGSDDDDGDLFAVKEQDADEKIKMDEEFAKFQAKADRRGDNGEEMMSNYWRADEDLGESERFLRDYIVNKQWLETGSLQTDPDSTKVDIEDESEDEEHLDEADEFEKEFNFRFEVEEGKQIQGHARFPEASVRERNDKRKRQRQERAERKEAEKVRRTEELKRLKNLKKQEIKRRLEQIKEVTGNQDSALESGVLDDDFDPDAHDTKMAEVLGHDYDERDEDLPEKELVKAPEGVEDLDISKAATEGLRKHWGVGQATEDDDQVEQEDGEEWQGNVVEQSEQDEDEDDEHPELWFLCDSCQKPILPGKRRFDCTVCEDYMLCMKCFRIRRHPHKFARKRVPERCAPPSDFKAEGAAAAETEKTLDDYFQLDYEDIIGGDLPTRFKYRKVEAKDYGIPAHVILAKSGKELNQMVSLKKLRTYRDDPGFEDEDRGHGKGKGAKGKGDGKGRRGGKDRGKGKEQGGQKKKQKKGSKEVQGCDDKVTSSRLDAYNLQADRFAGKGNKPWQKKTKNKAQGSKEAA